MKVRSPLTQMPEDFFGAVWRRTAMLNQKMVDITYINLHFAFELARAKTFSDVLTLQADYWQKLFAALQGEQLRFKAAEPQPAVNQEENVEKELVYSQPKRKDESSPVVDIVNQQPKRRPEQRPKQSAGTHNRKAEKSRSKLKDRRPPSRQAHTDQQKQRARHEPAAQGRRAEIKFGRLDDDAVRFSSLEAWRLHNGTWRPISVDEVLSDAVVLSQARFDKLFPRLPQLPTKAFLSGQKTSRRTK